MKYRLGLPCNGALALSKAEELYEATEHAQTLINSGMIVIIVPDININDIGTLLNNIKIIKPTEE